jgi:hypothetical protein
MRPGDRVRVIKMRSVGRSTSTDITGPVRIEGLRIEGRLRLLSRGSPLVVDGDTGALHTTCVEQITEGRCWTEVVTRNSVYRIEAIR